MRIRNHKKQLLAVGLELALFALALVVIWAGSGFH
jgi:hypothetical protein